MSKHFIEGVPQYYEPYVADCFQNVLGSVIAFKGLNPQLVLADYLSFMYDQKKRLCRCKLLKPAFSDRGINRGNAKHIFGIYPLSFGNAVY